MATINPVGDYVLANVQVQATEMTYEELLQAIMKFESNQDLGLSNSPLKEADIDALVRVCLLNSHMSMLQIKGAVLEGINSKRYLPTDKFLITVQNHSQRWIQTSPTAPKPAPAIEEGTPEPKAKVEKSAKKES